MPDSHKGLPEIITAFERGGKFFGVVSISLAGVSKKYEFDIDEASYRALKRLVNMRPFGRKRGIKTHYYYAPGFERSDASKTYCQMRIEREYEGKEFEIEAPETLTASLGQFLRVKDWKALAHLREFK